MSIPLRILAVVLLAATLLAADEESAESVGLHHLRLFPAVSREPGSSRSAPADRESRPDGPHLVYAIWDELGREIQAAAVAPGTGRRAALLGDSGGSEPPPLASLQGIRSSGEPAPAPSPSSISEAARERERVDQPRLDLYQPRGLVTPEVDGVRGFLELHLVGEVGVSFGFAVEF